MQHDKPKRFTYSPSSRWGTQPVRMPYGGSLEAVAGGGQFLIYIDGYRRWTEGNDSKPLYRYSFLPMSLNADGVPVPGPPPDPAMAFRESVYASNQGAVKLYYITEPTDQTEIPYATPTTTITFKAAMDASAFPDSEGWSIAVGTTVGGTEIGSKLLGDPVVGEPISGIPTDGSTFYVRFYSYLSNMPNGWRDYECSIETIDTRKYALHIDAINRVAIEQQEGPIGGNDPSVTAEPWQPLDPFAAWAVPVAVTDREDITLAFHCPDVEYWGKVVVNGPTGQPPYQDARYWVQLQKLTNTTSDPYAKFTFANRTTPKDLIVLANNLPELPHLWGESHKLPTDCIVRVRCTRGGDHPHVPRYWLETVTPAAAGTGVTGSFNIVTRLCIDSNNCVYAYVTAEFVYVNGILTAVIGYGDSCPPPPT